MMQTIGGTCNEHGPFTGPRCLACPAPVATFTVPGEPKMTNKELTDAIKEAFLMARGTSNSEGAHGMAEQHYNALLAVQLARAKAS